MDYFKELVKIISPFSVNDGLQCSCKRSQPDFCDNIAYFLQLTKTNKNFNSENAKHLYSVIIDDYILEPTPC